MADLKIYKVNELPSPAGDNEIYFNKTGSTVALSVSGNDGSVHAVSSIVPVLESDPASGDLVEGLQWYLKTLVSGTTYSYQLSVYLDGEIKRTLVS